MFTKDDYIAYFEELERQLKDVLTIYTDLLNEIDDKSIRNKLMPLSTESMEVFKYVKSEKGTISKEK
jgi:hypothetical protein